MDTVAAKKRVEAACEKKLNGLFPHGIPEVVYSRYQEELELMEETRSIEAYEIFRCVSERAREEKSAVFCRGTVTGSYLYYLLGNHTFDPMPAHYYCRNCGRYEVISRDGNKKNFGVDFAEKSCPQCGDVMESDGFDLEAVSVFGIEKKPITFEYNIEESFRLSFADVLAKLYPEQKIVPLGMDVTAWGDSNDRSVQPFQANRGLLILPKGKTVEDYSEYMLRLKSGEPCFSLSLASDVIRRDHMKSVRISNDRRLEQIGRMEQITGISRDDIRCRDENTIRWQDLFNVTERPRDRFLMLNLRPETFSGIIEAYALASNTYKESVLEDIERNHSDAYREFPYSTREDFYEAFCSYGMSKEDAFVWMELVRSGKIASHVEKAKTLDLPEKLIELMTFCRYVFPRAHIIQQAYLSFWRGFYASADWNAFMKTLDEGFCKTYSYTY